MGSSALVKPELTMAEHNIICQGALVVSAVTLVFASQKTVSGGPRYRFRDHLAVPRPW